MLFKKKQKKKDSLGGLLGDSKVGLKKGLYPTTNHNGQNNWNIFCHPIQLRHNRELKNHDEVHDDDVRLLGKDWNENVGFGGKKEG